ncbi:ferredoxin [Bacillus sp. J14TS2]|uniref:ferredoxin n=1 Tax=Bacillus sp. J14TS2 TaxID=2807188 RepID=UPI001B283AD3|nr:ferredoxin [Bacillus sp. J14TS2]GIN72866.1 ferredoxin [Bacillus sp. J14TS2]
MEKYAIINQETCICCGNCEGLAPDIFDLDQDGVAFVKLDQNRGSIPVPEDQIDSLIDAMEECPTDSVKIADQPFDNE